MRCEEVRSVLPELADGEAAAPEAVERHLRGCAACSGELERYRALLFQLRALREVLVEPAPGLLGRILAQVPEPERRSLLRRVAADERLFRAVLSVGGAVVGATAVGLLWWRASRRAVAAGAAAEAGEAA
ncbi:MAG TPA: zf-HC2 domain-containing protein [Actinomycetota bacterium]|nr:zf-HC2 domain-containing protein [Actinomycetota bacterium]